MSLDVQGILERAGADPNAPEGSQGWALAQVANAIAQFQRASGTAVLNIRTVLRIENDLELGSIRKLHDAERVLNRALAQVGAA